MKSVRSRWGAVGFAFCLLCVPAQAQKGELAGTVVTALDSAVTGATVTLTNPGTGASLTSTTDKDGQYRIAVPEPGLYDFSIRADAYQQQTRRNIRVSEGALRMDVTLQAEKDISAASVKEWETAIARNPDDYLPRFNLGRAYFARGKLEKAGEQFTKALDLHPDSRPVLLALARLADRRGDAAGTLKYAQQALKLKPANGDATLLLAGAYIRMHRFEESGDLLNKILKDNPNDVEALLELGVQHITEKQYFEAEDMFRHAYALDPSNMRGLLGVSEIHFVRNEPEKAVQVFAAEVKKEPQRRDLRKELATIEFRAKQYDKAIADYQAIVDQYKDSPIEQAEIYGRLGQAYTQTGDLQRSVDHLKKATQLAPDNNGYLEMLADCYGNLGKKQEAITSYRAALKMEPNNPLVMNNLAYLLSNTGGDLDEALEMAQKARRQLPDFNEVQDTIGWIYLKKNLAESAARIFEDLSERYPKNATFHYHYALAEAQKGDKDGARKELKLALQNNPGKQEEALIKELMQKLSPPTTP